MKNNLPFKDKHGRQVHVGDTIRILKNYNYQHLNGQVCTVLWDEKNGMFLYEYHRKFYGEIHRYDDNFYGVHEFEIIDNE